MTTPSPDELKLVEQLKLKVLRRFDQLLDSGEISPTDVKTLVSLLTQNGWNLDATKVPENLQHKLKDFSPQFDDSDDEQVISLLNRRAG